MDVRDLTKSKTEYKGHEIQAGSGSRNCPCLPCFVVHDCGWSTHNGWVKKWDCATRHNQGCPLKLKRVHHIFHVTKRWQKRRVGSIFKCLRCGQSLKMGDDFDFHSIEKKQEDG